MEWKILINPVVGGIIGYATNYLAIKMLFRPHKPKYIGQMKVPFTPGLIPKEKEKLARQMGQITEDYLLTEDMLVDTLTDPKAKAIFFNLTNEIFDQIEASDQGIGQAAEKIWGKRSINQEIIIDRLALEMTALLTSKEVMDVSIPYLVDALEDMLKQQTIQSYLEQLGHDILENEQTKEYMKTSLQSLEEKIYVTLEENAANIGKSILVAIAEGEEASRIKETMEDWIQENFNPMVSIFIKVDKIYEGLINFAQEALEDPQQSAKFGQLLCTVAKGLKDSSGDYQGKVSHMIKGQINQGNIHKLMQVIFQELSQKDAMAKEQMKEWLTTKWTNYTRTIEFTHIIKNILKQVIQLVAQIPIKNISAMIASESKERISQSMFQYYSKAIVKNSNKVAQLMDVSALVENKINEFSSEEAETVILSVVKEQLRGITWIGALLGSLIGIISNFLS